jgi:tRNA nucleotidyltransferase (CCA-adding enzyme)
MRELDLLKFVHPSLKGGTEMERLFSGISEALTWFRMLYLEGVSMDKWFIYFLGLLDRLKDGTVDEVLERLSAPARIRERVRQARARYHDALYMLYREPGLKPSSIHDLLATLDTEALLLMMAKAKQEAAKRAISLYLTHLREVRIALTGDDLKKLGIPPGPRYKKLMASLLDAKLDGFVSTREEEIAFIRQKTR